MPFTPFHFGPGLVIKGLIPERFSLSMFALANVAMDIEPLYHMWHGDAELHGASHTLLGAAFIGSVAAQIGRTAIMRAWQVYGRWSASACVLFPITRTQAWASSMLGTFSHLLLDGMMHADMHPFLPFTDFNPLLGISSTENVYLGCILAGMAGILINLVRAGFQPERTR